MKDKMTENFIEILFREYFDIKCEKINENKGQKGKTPDFFLCKNNLKFAICEIKEITDDVNDGTWEKINENGIESFEKIGAPAITKIAHKIKDAYKQMEKHSLLKVLVFVNYYSDYIETLKFVIKGHSYAKDIDLYIWIDKGSVGKKDKIYFEWVNNKGEQLRKYFKY